MADSGKPSAEAYNASSVAGENTHEGALRGTCPDDGRCHHSCLTQGPCFRELACGSLSAAGYPQDQWPPELVRGHRELDALYGELAAQVTASLLADLDSGFSDTGWDHGDPGPEYILEEIAAPPLTRPARLPLDVVAVPPGWGPDHFGGTP
jgi:hypothetical protein